MRSAVAPGAVPDRIDAQQRGILLPGFLPERPVGASDRNRLPMHERSLPPETSAAFRGRPVRDHWMPDGADSLHSDLALHSDAEPVSERPEQIDDLRIVQ